MRPVTLLLSLSLLVAPSSTFAKPNQSKHGKYVQKKQAEKIEKQQKQKAVPRDYFAPRDVRVIRDYYAPRYKSLPPGLQKKLYRTGTLPPGWQKKLRPMPAAIERQLVPIPSYYRRGVIDDYAVVYDPRRHVIVDLTPVYVR